MIKSVKLMQIALIVIIIVLFGVVWCRRLVLMTIKRLCNKRLNWTIILSIILV